MYHNKARCLRQHKCNSFPKSLICYSDNYEQCELYPNSLRENPTPESNFQDRLSQSKGLTLDDLGNQEEI